jgi:hypothetical protein
MEFAFLTSFFFAWSITCARRSSYYHGADLANLGRITVAFIGVGAFILLSGRGLLAFEKTPMRLPTTNGSVKHDVDLNDGVLKKVQTLKLVDGQVKLPINATIAGELRLSATLKEDA